jgi:CubicO group peptidase (beta-lactamase class C family)
MKDLLGSLPALQSALDTLAARNRVPGAMLSVFDGDRTVDLVTGVTNCETGVDVTPETLFQIGSITKVFTATLMMRLVDQGKIDLDAPVRRYLPSFQLSDERAAETVTSRHLINHSSGMVGDYLADHGPGDDCLDRYVASLKEHEYVHPPGLMFSYSNAGFTVAGRVIEAVCERPFDEVFTEELLKPLGLRCTTVLPEQMLRYRYAVGHNAAGTAPPAVPPSVLVGRYSVPAGGRTSASAADVLRFVRMHIDKGRASDGSIVVSEAGIAAMRTPSLPLIGNENSHIGLGWLVADWGDETCLFHTGGTIGQLSFVCVLPDRPFAVCLLTNSDTGGELWRELGSWVFETVAGIGMPKVPKPPAVPPSIDLARYAAVYERLTQRFDVEARDDHLSVTIATSGHLGADSRMEVEFLPIDESRFYANVGYAESVMTFLEPDRNGLPRYLHYGSRAAVRRNSSPADEAARGTG